ncbi:hypothetical protein HU200_029780 [Digitaria exilis]|uniref:BI1-like protein n=1 Tax=Digitaria exilis TaxID=1010633 RepID=A0A835BYM5_9POAL|nr:hypothetical protein HU200_029780 [Digitaria exilis]
MKTPRDHSPPRAPDAKTKREITLSKSRDLIPAWGGGAESAALLTHNRAAPQESAKTPNLLSALSPPRERNQQHGRTPHGGRHLRPRRRDCSPRSPGITRARAQAAGSGSRFEMEKQEHGDAIGEGILQHLLHLGEIWWGRERELNEDDDAATRVRLAWAESDGAMSPPTLLSRAAFVVVFFHPHLFQRTNKPKLLSVLVLNSSCHHRVVVVVSRGERERPAATMWGYQKAPDLEAGGSELLYPGMTESPDLRWAFVRKIYVILAVQLAMTAVVSGFVVKVPAISEFFVSSNTGIALYIFLIILPFIVLCPLHYYHQKHPVNLLLLGLFTVAISFAVGMTCAFTSDIPPPAQRIPSLADEPQEPITGSPSSLPAQPWARRRSIADRHSGRPAMGKHGKCSHDAEACYPPAPGGYMYPYMMESPQIRWAFIRKVYVIVLLQLLLTVAVAAAVNHVAAIGAFFRSRTLASLGAWIAVVLAPFVALMIIDRSIVSFLVRAGDESTRHPINLVLLTLFTICMSFSVGLSCLTAKGVIVVEAAAMTLVVVVGLTAYTFWAAKRGHDFEFLGPFLVAASLILIVFLLMRMLFPMGKTGTLVYGCIAALIFSGFIIYDTDNLIKRFSYDEYIVAAIELYLDIINLFQAILSVLEAIDG